MPAISPPLPRLLDLSRPWPRIVLPALPFVILMVWTCLVRLPFYMQTDKDEFFFSIVAARWLEGNLPYVASFDVKPPGIFFIFAMVQGLFGQSLATIKLMEMGFVTVGAFGLHRMLKAHGTERSAVWAAGLYPVFTLTLAGVDAVSMIVQLPFVIYSFWAILSCIADKALLRDRLIRAALSGLCIGMAGMIKQTAIFEAIAVFTVLCLYGRQFNLWALIIAFTAGAALPGILFSFYFWSMGHFRELFEAVIVLASQRTAPDVLAGYGPEAASEFTVLGTLKNTFLPSVPLVFLWAGAMLAGLRFKRVSAQFPPRLLVLSVIWLAASILGVMAGRGLCTYYLLGIVPPLLILAAALFSHGIGKNSQPSTTLMIASALAAAISMAYVDHKNLFSPDPILAGDYLGEEQVSLRLFDLGLTPNDHLLVLNRGYRIYMRTHAKPASPYFHATHLLGVFHTPSVDPLGEALNARPRFIVIADPSLYHITEQPARYRRTIDFVTQNYASRGKITGSKDSFYIFERR